MIVSMLFSIIIYFLCIYFLRSYLFLSELNWEFVGKMTLITAASWVPPYLFKVIMKRIDPSDYEKVMRHKKNKL